MTLAPPICRWYNTTVHLLIAILSWWIMLLIRKTLLPWAGRNVLMIYFWCKHFGGGGDNDVNAPLRRRRRRLRTHVCRTSTWTADRSWLHPEPGDKGCRWSERHVTPALNSTHSYSALLHHQPNLITLQIDTAVDTDVQYVHVHVHGALAPGLSKPR